MRRFVLIAFLPACAAFIPTALPVDSTPPPSHTAVATQPAVDAPAVAEPEPVAPAPASSEASEAAPVAVVTTSTATACEIQARQWACLGGCYDKCRAYERVIACARFCLTEIVP